MLTDLLTIKSVSHEATVTCAGPNTSLTDADAAEIVAGLLCPAAFGDDK